MALETLNNRYRIRHFDEGGSTDTPTGTVTVTGAPAFDAGYYLAQNPDVAASSFASDPYSHHTQYGQSEGRAATAETNTAPAYNPATNIASPTFSAKSWAEQGGLPWAPPPPVGGIDVAGLYTNILGRPLDQAGYDYWTKQAQEGASLDAITQSFKNSAEYKALPQTTTTPAPVQGALPTPGSTQAIKNWYQNTLGRPADESGLAAWSKAFGDKLDLTELALLNQSTEAQNRNAIVKSYTNDLGRTGSADEYNNWMKSIAGGQSLADVQKNIANSPEGQLYAAYMAETGRKPDPNGAKYFSNRLAQGATIDQIRKEMNASEEGQTFDINSLYKDALFRDVKSEELPAIKAQLNQGYTMDQLREKTFTLPEAIVAQDYMKYTGRAPDAAGSKYWQDQLALGKTKEQIAHEIALSNESITANSASVKANLEAVLGKNVVAGMTPAQIDAYTKTILDPTRWGSIQPVTKDQFDAKYYLAQNPDVARDGIDPYSHYRQFGIYEGRAGNAAAATPAYLTQADNLKEVYRQIALDPILGAKLRAENPLLWEKVTPLTSNPDQIIKTERIYYGQYGTIDMDGVKVPILNAKLLDGDGAFGGANSGTIQDTSHGRNSWVEQLGWRSNSFSSAIKKGADALGVVTYFDEDGRPNSFTGLNEAADLLKIDKTQFKDKREAILSKEATDEAGNIVTKGGQPIYKQDGEGGYLLDDKGNKIPETRIVSAESQLYDAVGAAAKDIYSVTGDSLTLGRAYEKGPQSFDTVMYRREGDKLIPISKPQAHGGMQNYDVYRPKDSFAAPLMMAVAVAAMVVAPELAPIIMESLAVSAGTAAVMTGVIVGAGVGATNATISGTSVGESLLKGGVLGGVTAGLTQGLETAFPPTVLQDGTKVANFIFTGASEMMGGTISPSGVQSVVSQTLARTLATATQSGASGDKILNAFGTALVSSGLSTAAADQIVSQMTAAGFDKDNVAKLARTVQLAVNTGSTAALSGKSNDQILQSIITGVISGSGSIASAKGEPPKIEPTNPFGTENVGVTSGSVDKVLQSQIMDGIANKTDDPIAFMNAAKNWTGDGSKNVEYVTTAMVKQGIPADQISQDLQALYGIPADKADEYAKYMVTKAVSTIKPTTTTTATTTTTQQPTSTTTTQQPTSTTTQTSAPVTAPAPDAYANKLFGSMVDAFSNPSVAGPAYAPLAQALPLSRYDVGSSSPLVTAGATQSNLGGTSPSNDPTSYRTYSPRPGADEYSNVYPSVFGKQAQDPNYIRELVEAYKSDPNYAPYREELQRLDPSNKALVSNEAKRVETPEQVTQTPSRVPSYRPPELSALPKPVETPMPMPEPRPQPEPMPATPSPNQPANDPFILPEPMTPGRKITPIMPVSPPGAIPTIAPNAIPTQDPNAPLAPSVKPITPGDQSVAPVTPSTPTGPVQEPTGEPEIKPTREQQLIIQQVAKTPEEGKKLEVAVPRVTQLITQGVPRIPAISTVATEVGVPFEDLSTVINATVPDVVPPTVTPPTVTPPTVTPPKVTAPKVNAPTTTAGRTGVISPFLLQQYGGIQDLSPGLTEGGNYSLSGIPSTNTNMNPMTPNSPLQQFASTSPPSPLELGAQRQPDEPIQMATGGSTTQQQQAYNPYDVSSGISGSLTPGLTKARLDYLLTGLPQGHAEGGMIEGHNPQFFSEGGLGSMENTFVEGEGDGTSDQVPAMLANGEFVIPADVVSGLGNGSNDAGAQVLQEFLKTIREHKHSAEANKLPPKSKGPLAYLTNAKRKVKVA